MRCKTFACVPESSLTRLHSQPQSSNTLSTHAQRRPRVGQARLHCEKLVRSGPYRRTFAQQTVPSRPPFHSGDHVWLAKASDLLKIAAAPAWGEVESRNLGQEQKDKRQALIAQAHQEYLGVAQHYLDKSRATLATWQQQGRISPVDVVLKLEIEDFMRHATRQIDQTRRRVIDGQVIPHAEKVFSIFEPHTEWVNKGKAGVQVELGLKTAIMEDQFQFILHHRLMQHEVDEQVTVAMVVQTKQRFPDFVACSFDKGFHSPSNQSELKQHLELVALPRKGKLSQAAQQIEGSPEFVNARRKHSAVESAINALEVHGLDVCPDHGINGCKRYVALAVVARNIHRIGAILKQQEQKREQRKKTYADRDTTYKLAA